VLGPAIGDLLPAALGVALSPVPVIAVVLMLATPRGRVNGLAFAIGWEVGLIAVSVLVLWLAGDADSSGGTRTGVDWLKIVFGLVLLLVAKRQWDARPAPGEEAPLPKWMGTLQDFDAKRSGVVGAALAAANPKNLVLTVAAAASIAQAGLSAGGDAVAIVVFVAIGSIGVAVPVIVYLVAEDRAAGPLAELRDWMARNSNVIMMVVCLVLAAKLVGAGIAGLSD
jgi:threonine/homoserine/homoserine lactone efflux protein